MGGAVLDNTEAIEAITGELKKLGLNVKIEDTFVNGKWAISLYQNQIKGPVLYETFPNEEKARFGLKNTLERFHIKCTNRW